MMRPLATTLILLSLSAAIGCSGGSGGREAQQSTLRLTAVLYSQYLGAHGGDPPRDEGEFKKFIQSLGPGVIERAGLTSVDQLFTSPRDGQPYAVKYQGVPWELEGAIAYEQQGLNGVRYVATSLGGISEVTEEEFTKRLKKAN